MKNSKSQNERDFEESFKIAKAIAWEAQVKVVKAEHNKNWEAKFKASWERSFSNVLQDAYNQSKKQNQLIN